MQNYLKTLIINASKQQQPRTLESKRFKTKKNQTSTSIKNQQNVHSSKRIKKTANLDHFFLILLVLSAFFRSFPTPIFCRFHVVHKHSPNLCFLVQPIQKTKKSGIPFGPLRYSKTKSNQKVPNPKRIPTKIIVKCMVLFRVFKTITNFTFLKS